MTEEERKEQTKKIYSLKMWDECKLKSADGVYMTYLRVPGGWVANIFTSMVFIPIGKEKDLNSLDTPKVRI